MQADTAPQLHRKLCRMLLLRPASSLAGRLCRCGEPATKAGEADASITAAQLGCGVQGLRQGSYQDLAGMQAQQQAYQAAQMQARESDRLRQIMQMRQLTALQVGPVLGGLCCSNAAVPPGRRLRLSTSGCSLRRCRRPAACLLVALLAAGWPWHAPGSNCAEAGEVPRWQQLAALCQLEPACLPVPAQLPPAAGAGQAAAAPAALLARVLACQRRSCQHLFTSLLPDSPDRREHRPQAQQPAPQTQLPPDPYAAQRRQLPPGVTMDGEPAVLPVSLHWHCHQHPDC